MIWGAVKGYFLQYSLVLVGLLAAAGWITAGVQTLRTANAQRNLALEQKASADNRANAEESARLAGENYRREDQRIRDEQQENANVQARETAQAKADAVAAADVAGKLRARINAITAAARAAAGDPQAQSGGEAIAAPVVVLSDVLGRLDDTAGELAAAIDAARSRGLRCERDYQALTPTNPISP